MNDVGTLVLTRAKTGRRDGYRSYKVLIDGAEAGKIKRGETLRFPLAAGRHTLQLKIDWCASRIRPFAVQDGQAAAFGCAPSDAFGGLENITSGAAKYITLRPLADPADLAALETVPHAEAAGYIKVVGVGFIAGFAALRLDLAHRRRRLDRGGRAVRERRSRMDPLHHRLRGGQEGVRAVIGHSPSRAPRPRVPWGHHGNRLRTRIRRV
ncbi:hypothetical protein [Actinospica robiniae]|uniref:hypothetical protein n=1 Tax=Actinospica robiniae TaxID=304901 RepID=UPI0012F8F3FB|nr:hypothetical protein [Actinospica robiniae]